MPDWNPARLSVSTRAVSRDLRRAVNAAAAAGFAGVEVWEEDAAQVGGVAAAGQLIRDCGMTISSFQVGRDIDGVPEDVFEKSRDAMRRLIDGCALVGASNVLCCSTMRDDASSNLARAVDQLGRIARDAEVEDVTIAFEALSMGRVRRRWIDAWRLVRAVAHPLLKLALDTTHCALMRDDVSGIAALPGDAIGFVQLADLASLDGDLLDINRRRRLFPGEGDIDFGPFLTAIDAGGYDGWISLEIFNAANMELPAADNAQRAMASLKRL